MFWTKKCWAGAFNNSMLTFGGEHTEKNTLYFFTNINRFQPSFKSDCSRLVNKSVRDIGHSKVIVSKPALVKKFGQVFRGFQNTWPALAANQRPSDFLSIVYSPTPFNLKKEDIIKGYLMMWHYESLGMTTLLTN